uniref:Uncharacterized protein n=1 Tax=Arion vulgaris TaxID=1028688 RepID=A0A0B7ASR6_9EUPU
MTSKQGVSVTHCSNSEEKVEKAGLCSKLPDHITVHAAHISEVHFVPMRILIRPIPSVLDETKVASLMETIQLL